MTEMVTSGSMSGGARRSDGLLGESGHERRRSQQAPPVLHATARVLDSTSRRRKFVSCRHEPALGHGECRRRRGFVDPRRHRPRRRDRHPAGETLRVGPVGAHRTDKLS
jgi:hypothetical protein